MKKRSRIAMFSCIMVCCAILMVIFVQYHPWSESMFNEMMFENQEAYAEGQEAEIAAKVGSVRMSLKAMVSVLETHVTEEELAETRPDMTSVGEDAGVREISYCSFSEETAEYEARVGKEFFKELRKGNYAISDIYKSEEDNTICYEIAEPVCLNGKYVGFARAIADAGTLLDTSQTGFLRDETEAYLLHENGNNVLMDYFPEADRKRLNMYRVQKQVCAEPTKINKLKNELADGKTISIIQSEAEGEPIFISVCRLPYNDWIIMNITQSQQMKRYADETAAQGRRAAFMAIAATVLIVGIMALMYFLNNKSRHDERKRSQLLENFSDTVLCEYDLKKDRLICTSNITSMLFIQEPIVEKFRIYARERELIHPQDMNAVKDILKYIPEEGEYRECQIRLKNREGIYNWYAVAVTALYTNSGKAKQLVMKITDITDSKREMIGLLQKSQEDALTGLLNREAFRQLVKESLELSGGGYLFLMDLDRFKHVNDEFGHRAGDEILKKMADCLRQCFRKGDYVGRFGGDEFLAFVPGQIDRQIIEKRAADLVAAVGRIKSDTYEELKVSCSVGVAKCQGESYEELLEKADKAMYSVKESGKNAWNLQ